jgi:hypothetical protein
VIIEIRRTFANLSNCSTLKHRSRKMAGSDNKELIEILKHIEKQLGHIKYDLADIKRKMPKVPFLWRPIAGNN